MSGKINTIYITFDGITDPLGQSQVLPYLEGLSKNGIKFYLISLEKNLKATRKLSKNIENIGISWYRLKYFRFYFLGTFINIIQCFALVFYLLLFKKIKIIHSRSYAPLFSALPLKKLFNFKLIFDMRGFWPEGLVETKRIKKDSLYYKMLKFLERSGILFSDYIVVLTPEAKEIIESIYRDKKLKIIWMPTCVDCKKFIGKDPIYIKDKFVMVYSGSLWSHYDASAMIDFFKVLKSKIANAHFLILGNNDSEKLRSLFSQRDIDEKDYTIFTLKSEDVPRYLLGSNLGISFRYDRYSEKATFPTKLAEYFISGLPVVMNSESSYIKKFVDSNKIGVVLEKTDNDSCKKAAEELILLLRDGDLKKRCIKTAEKYLSNKICVDKYMDIYKELE